MTSRNMTRLSFLGALAFCAAALPAAMADGRDATQAPIQGSIRVEGRHKQAELQKMAKISQQQAEKTALAAVAGKDADKKLVESELEVEDGFLVYSIEVAVSGQKGVEEILVDAGNGKILGREQEAEDDDDDAGGSDDSDDPDDDDR